MTGFDPDFGKAGFARHLFRLRFRDLRLSQRAFADRFGLAYSVVRDAEQGARPTSALRLIVAAIATDPAFMASAATMARQPCTCGECEAIDCCTQPAGYRRTAISTRQMRARVGDAPTERKSEQ